MQEKWRWLEELSTEDVTYLQQMPFSLSIPSHGCVVTHAGMVPGTPLNEQQLFDLIEVKSPHHRASIKLFLCVVYNLYHRTIIIFVFALADSACHC